MSSVEPLEKALARIAVLLATLLVSASWSPGQIQASGDDRPNIILILADDMGWSDIGSFGGEIETPHLDQLASSGLRFTQMHNTSKCFPSRAALLSGQYAQFVGMGRRPASLSANAPTIAEVAARGRLQNAHVGQTPRHRHPHTRGFDRYFGLRDGATNHFNPGLPRPEEAAPAQKLPGKRNWCIDAECVQPFTPRDPRFYSTDAYTDKAIEYLDEYAAEGRPFFLYLSYQAPHDPLQAWPEDIAKYRGRYLAGYQQIRAKRYQRQKELGIIDATYPLPEATHANWESLSEAERDEADLRMAVYAAMIDRMDRNIGRLLEQLEEADKRDNTLILFASDNGSSAEVVEFGDGEIGTMTRWASLGSDWANVSNTPLQFFKNHSYQGGISTPMIAAWPEGIRKKGTISNFPAHFIDVLPTLAELGESRVSGRSRNGTDDARASGAEQATSASSKGQERKAATLPGAPDNSTREASRTATQATPEHDPSLRGLSLAPIFKGQTAQRAAPLFWHWMSGRAVRDGRWKLVSSTSGRIDGTGTWELYDMASDRTESKNLADTHPAVVSDLAAKYEEWWNKLPSDYRGSEEP